MWIKSALKNVKYTILTYLINYILKFVVRLVFIQKLSIEVLGFHSVTTDIFSMLSFFELGVGPAVIFSLYKPLAHKDYRKVKAILNYLKRMYKFVAIIIFIVGVFISFYLNNLIKNIESIENIQILFFILLVNASVSYLLSYKRSLLIADQNQYIDNLYHCLFQIILSFLQIISMIIFSNYIVFVLLILLSTILENIVISIRINKLYSYIFKAHEEKLSVLFKNDLWKNIKALVFHKIGEIINIGAGNIILAKYIGLTSVGLYSNYILITNAVDLFISQCINSLTSVIGNYIVIESQERNIFIFKVLNFVIAFIASIMSVFIYLFINDIITIWIGEKYLLGNLISLSIAARFYLEIMRKVVLVFRAASGLYWHDRYKTIIQAIVNIMFSIYLTIHFGIVGVVWGWIICIFVVCFVVEPYILFKYAINVKMKEYYSDYFKFSVITFILGLCCKMLKDKLFVECSIVNLLLCAILSSFIIGVTWRFIFKNRDEMAWIAKFIKERIKLKLA